MPSQMLVNTPSYVLMTIKFELTRNYEQPQLSHLALPLSHRPILAPV